MPTTPSSGALKTAFLTAALTSMTKKPTKYLLMSALNVTISTLFIVAGITISSGEAPLWIKASGYLTLCYGVISVLLLILSWRKSIVKAESLTKYAALGFMAFFFAASWDVGMISGLEWIGIVVVAILLSLQWHSIRSITKREAKG
jgi:hypothetical protein